jgi:hypothetical protein
MAPPPGPVAPAQAADVLVGVALLVCTTTEAERSEPLLDAGPPAVHPAPPELVCVPGAATEPSLVDEHVPVVRRLPPIALAVAWEAVTAASAWLEVSMTATTTKKSAVADDFSVL